MLPLAYVVLDELPLSPNGKVDRRQLPDWRLAVNGDARSAQARDDVERELVGLWREVLEVPDVRLDDDFFHVGGHSFLAVRMIAEINERLGVQVPLSTLFRNPTVEKLADAVRSARGAGASVPRPATPASTAIPRLAAAGRLPVTLVQENHLRREQWRDARGLPDRALNVDIAYRLRGRLDEPALLAALNALVRRHDALRVRFEAVDDTFVQVIQDSATVRLETLVPEPATDPLSGVKALLHRRSREHSNRWAPGPRLRAGVVRLGPDDQVLSLGIDHLLCDGWSLGVLLRELSRLYAGDDDLPEPALRYGDWVRWACERLDSPEGERDRAYWLEQLGDISPRQPVEFPFRPRGRRLPGLAGVMTTAAMPAGLARPAGYGSGLTPFVLFCTAVQLMLHAATGEPAVGVISPVANRGRQETHDLVGWLSNTVVLRLDVHETDRIQDAAARTRVALEGAIEHGEHTVHDIIRRLSPGVFGRIRDTASAYVSTHLDPPEAFTLRGLDMEPLRFDDPFSLHGIQFGLRPAGDGLEVAILCESEWLTRADLDGLGADLRLVAEAVITRPDLSIADLRRSLALAHPRFRTRGGSLP